MIKRYLGRIVGSGIGGIIGPLGIPFGFGVGALVDYAVAERRRWTEVVTFVQTGNANRVSYADVYIAGAVCLGFYLSRRYDPGILQDIEALLGAVFGGRAQQRSRQLLTYLEYSGNNPDLPPVLRAMDERLAPEHRDRLRALLGLGPGKLADLPGSFRSKAAHGSDDGDEQAAEPVDLATAYRILGVSPRVTDRQLKAAYRRLAVQFHPDAAAPLDEARQEQSSGAFQRIRTAYESVLESRRSIRAPIDDSRSTNRS
ncbi:MAG: J domain-containing protein [Spirochaeta sp.]